MTANWPKLSKPPVDVALFQLKYDLGETELKNFLKVESQLKEIFPKRANNVTANIDLPSSPIPLGVSKITGTSNAKVTSYTFYSANQKSKLTITENSITLVSEDNYEGWDAFETDIEAVLNILSPVLSNYVITRVSIRFINKFTLDNFDNPEKFFKTMISTTEESVLPYSVKKYGFRIMLDVDDDTYSIVNQNVDTVSDKFIYLFDIDVLNRTNSIFDVDLIKNTLSKLREIKNRIFFGNITNNLIELCR